MAKLEDMLKTETASPIMRPVPQNQHMGWQILRNGVMLTGNNANSSTQSRADTQSKSIVQGRTSTKSTPVPKSKIGFGNSFDDDFIQGFNSVDDDSDFWEDAQQRRMKQLIQMGNIENKSDLFLAGFNSADTGQTHNRNAAKLFEIAENFEAGDMLKLTIGNMPSYGVQQNNEDADVSNHNSTITKGTAAGFVNDPLAATPYKIIDRHKIYQNNASNYLDRNGNSLLKYPDGRFGITLDDLPEITQNTKTFPRVNTVFRLDDIHKNVVYPHININGYAIKQHNSNQIDKIANLIKPSDKAKQRAFLAKVEEYKTNRAKMIDQAVKMDNEVLKRATKGDIKYDHRKIGKGWLGIAENSAKITKIGGVALGVAGAVADARTIGQAMSDDLEDDNRIGEGTVKAFARVGGESVGAALGAKGGSALGAWVFGAAAGIYSGGLLAAPAAALGGSIGGFLGGIGGSCVFGWLAEEGADAVFK